ncbi:16S rRNA (guanine(527)-N(7))-methyltransferase RsmG, partial [Candidatus Latescibacterota bacterium]
RSRWEDQLGLFVELLTRWSLRMNLVAAGDRPHLVSRHLAPALELRSLLQSMPHERVADVGSGAGLPGIPLQITLPASHFVLVESRRRRASFLREVVRVLGLGQTDVVNERVEEVRLEPAGADVVVMRGLAMAPPLVPHLSRILASHGVVVASLPSGPPPAIAGARMVREWEQSPRSRWAVWKV